ncbi:MAG: hypothetical protein Q7S76_00945, partial [bacterium]|nr:hypothetical protein [bacterium]
WAIAFLPLLVAGIVKMGFPKERRTGFLAAVLGYTGIILSHTISGYIATIFLLLYLVLHFVCSPNDRASLGLRSSMMAVSLLLTSFFWLPAMFEMHYTNVSGQIGSTASFFDHFVCPAQLWDSLWEFGGSISGCIDGMSFKLGKLHVLFVGLSLLFGIFGYIRAREIVFFRLALTSLGISLLFMNGASRIFWQAIPGFAFIQYPWRFLSLSAFGISVLASLVISSLRSTIVRRGSALIVLFAIVVLYAKLFVPQYTYDTRPETFADDSSFWYDVSKISDEYLPSEIPRPNDIREVRRGTIQTTKQPKYLELEEDTETSIIVRIDAETELDIFVWRAFIPGWRFWVDGREVQPKLSYGFPNFTLLPGYHTLEAKFMNTPVRTAGNALSVLSCIAVVYWYGKKAAS